MHSVIQAGIWILVALFAAGWLGSIIVVLISGVEDLKTVFTKDRALEHHQPIES